MECHVISYKTIKGLTRPQLVARGHGIEQFSLRTFFVPFVTFFLRFGTNFFANIFCSIWNIFCSCFHANHKKKKNNKASFRTFERAVKNNVRPKWICTIFFNNLKAAVFSLRSMLEKSAGTFDL